MNLLYDGTSFGDPEMLEAVDIRYHHCRRREHSLCREVVMKQGACFCDRFFYLRFFFESHSDRVAVEDWNDKLCVLLEGIHFRWIGYTTVLLMDMGSCYIRGERGLHCLVEYFNAADGLKIAERLSYDEYPGERIPCWKLSGSVSKEYIGDFICTRECCLGRINDIVNGFKVHVGHTVGSQELIDNLLVDY